MDSSIEASQIGVVLYGLAAALFLFLAALLAVSWQRRLQGGLLILASIMTAAWAGVHAYAVALPFGGLQVYLLPLADGLRNAAWYVFLLKALGLPDVVPGGRRVVIRAAALAIVAVAIGLGAMGLWSAAGGHQGPEPAVGQSLLLAGNLLLAVVGLLLVEQLCRNSAPEHRWGLKFLCIGIGGIFAYDFYMYADAVLFGEVNPLLEYARGGIAAIVVPLIAISANRLPHWSVEVFVSRHVVFHSVTLTGAGIFLLAMAAAGYYIRARGGGWGPVLQAIFLFGALIVLAALLFSGKLRAELKVFINKHFYKNKYDYREEWRRFTELFSRPHDSAQFRLTVLKTMAGITRSQKGALWLKLPEHNQFRPVEAWNVDWPQPDSEPNDSAFVRFMSEREWVINLTELSEDAAIYDGLEPAAWVKDQDWPWLIVPMMQQEQLVGFVVLGRGNVNIEFNWEDSDLLKMVGRQAASYFAWLEADEALAQARQFETFNRLSAFVVHDLKNLVAQLSLVVSNARLHIGNPEFMTDAVDTVENAVNKMNHLLTQLRKHRQEGQQPRPVVLSQALRAVVAAQGLKKPVPTLVEMHEGLKTLVDPYRLEAVLHHLIQNAQDATPNQGKVEVRLESETHWAMIHIADTGCGMDDEFIRHRLFRPFDTTKGNAGMGVGVYESRQFARAVGGDLTVDSRPDEGTTFTLRLPLYRRSNEGNQLSEHCMETSN